MSLQIAGEKRKHMLLQVVASKIISVLMALII